MSDFITNGELRIEAERLCDEYERLTTENAKLRKENERLIIKLNAEHIVRQNVVSENTNLRKLVDGLQYCANEAHGMCARKFPGSDKYIDRCPLYGGDGSYGCERLINELGIEVSDV